MEQNLKTQTKSCMRVFVYAMCITKVEISQPCRSIFLWALSEVGECYNRWPFFSFVHVTYLTNLALCFVTCYKDSEMLVFILNLSTSTNMHSHFRS